MSKLQSRRVQDRKGAVTVITAVSLILLLGVAALAVDAGRLYRERRNTQAAADEAADLHGEINAHAVTDIQYHAFSFGHLEARRLGADVVFTDT